MPNRLTRIYTRTGDDGSTNLRKERFAKNHPLVATLGDLDELNCAIGLVLSLEIADEKIKSCFIKIQNTLFDMGGELAEPEYHALTKEHVTELENLLDEWNATLSPLKEFLLPQGTPATVACHLARTVCRRAERTLVTLHQEEPLKNIEILHYINRLSDLLFVAARKIGQGEETIWHPLKRKEENDIK